MSKPVILILTLTGFWARPGDPDHHSVGCDSSFRNEPDNSWTIVKPWPQTLSPKTQKPKAKRPWADTKISPLIFQQKNSQVDSVRNNME